LADEALQIAEPVPGAYAMLRLTRAWACVEIDREPGPDFDFRLTPSLRAAPIELSALRAWHAADTAGAAEAFASAAAGWQGFDTPHALLCRWGAAESLRRTGTEEDAIVALRDVLEEGVAMGFEPLVARVRRSLRLAGVRETATIQGRGAAAGGLTTRERELVALVERGLTNAEIARRLGLGRPTVARMLASAMTKLNVSSRAQLAAAVPL
jgi:DNA-binding CsgD family transcriptional regulator